MSSFRRALSLPFILLTFSLFSLPAGRRFLICTTSIISGNSLVRPRPYFLSPFFLSFVPKLTFRLSFSLSSPPARQSRRTSSRPSRFGLA